MYNEFICLFVYLYYDDNHECISEVFPFHMILPIDIYIYSINTFK